MKSNPINEMDLEHWWHTPTAAIFSGGLSALICYSFEGLKKRAQSRQPINLASFYPRNLYRGVSGFSASVGPTTLIQLTLNKMIKSFTDNPDSDSTRMLAALVSGTAGGFVSTAVEHTILTQQLQQTGPINAIKHMVRKHGPFRPWTGLTAICVREAGFGSSTMYFSEAAGARFRKQFGDTELMGWMGNLSVGITAALLTHPFDTVATRQQCEEKHVNMLNMARRIYAEAGLSGFYKGAGWRVLLFTGVMLVISKSYEPIKHTIQDTHVASKRLFLFPAPPSPKEKDQPVQQLDSESRNGPKAP